MKAIISLMLALTGCKKMDYGISVEEINLVKTILEGHIVNKKNNLTALQLMSESLADIEIVFEKKDDVLVEATAMGYVKNTGQRAYISYIVNLQNRTCEEGSFTGNVDWDYIIDNIEGKNEYGN